MTSPLPDGVTRDNWRSAPGARWAIRNIAALLPVAGIAAGEAAPLPEDPVDLSGFRLEVSSGDLQGFLKATATDGLVIPRDGRLVFEFYAGGMTVETPHILMSASKAVTGLIAGRPGRRGQARRRRPGVSLRPRDRGRPAERGGHRQTVLAG